MPCNLYGKLPTKRDFIALGASRDFLNAWEPWLQSGVSASQATLGEQWQRAFLRAPIWRFWLGAELCGFSAVGAFMPSLDKVGRYFPLTVFACAGQGSAIPPPEINAQDAWFKAAEDFLISTLDHETTFETAVQNLEQLAMPVQTETLNEASADVFVERGAAVTIQKEGKPFTELFSSLRHAQPDKICSGATCWWTIGGEDFSPMAFCANRMPDPFLFAVMLTGQFAAAPV
jgi:type VI secretion system protein ImpM